MMTYSIAMPTDADVDAITSIMAEADDFNPTRLSKIQSEYQTLLAMLHHASNTLNIPLVANQYAQLITYLDTLLLWNKTYNLTAITNPTEALVKHIIDCMSIIPMMPDSIDNTNNIDNVDGSPLDMLDIGAGAGLPSVIIAICQPQRLCTPLDSNQKRIRFIRQVAGELGLTNIKPVASRIENFSGTFPLITSRAFASLLDFVELAEPYLSDDGKLVAMKGKPPQADELQALQQDWVINPKPLVVPYLDDSRHLVELQRK